MAREAQLGVAAIGDPLQPATWSGTPREVALALEGRGAHVVGFDMKRSVPQRGARFLEYLTRVVWARRSPIGALPIRISIWRGRSGYLRLRSMRRSNGGTLRRLASAAGVDRVLHMSDLTVPLEPDDLQHYLVCDSTWHAITAEAPPDPRMPLRMIREFEALERQVYGNVEHFFPLSEHAAVSLRSHYGIDPRRVTPIGSGPGPLAPFQGEKDYAARRILFAAGRRFEEKGGELLLEAFRIARPRLEGAELTMVGDPRYERRLSGIPNVVALGHVPPDRIQSLFDEASLFAMPAPAEPWGLVYLEALASKTPILGLKRHAFPELSGDGRYGFVVDEPTPSAVADALVDALSDPSRLQMMGEEGQQRCLSDYTWDRVADRIGEVLNEPTGGEGR